MDNTVGYRSNSYRYTDGGRVACVHGEVCREYLKGYSGILSLYCPYECKYYAPVRREDNGKQW